MDRGQELIEECRRLSDEELLGQLESLAAAERGSLVRVLVRLSELERRALAQACGYPSVFLYCVRKLRYCESAAYKRTKAAEACQRFPFLLDLLEEGALRLSALAMLAPHLTWENCRTLARKARELSSRELERYLAGFSPPGEKPRDRVRFVAVRKPEPESQPDLLAAAAPAPPKAPVAICAKISFACSEEVERMLQRVKALLWHKYPFAQFEDVLGEVLRFYLDRKDPDRKKPAEPRPTATRSRRIPQWVKDEVWKRDGGRCAFAAADGSRCQERSGLEYDHVVPWALGGPSDRPGNVRLLCRAHNQARLSALPGSAAPIPAGRPPGTPCSTRAGP